MYTRMVLSNVFLGWGASDNAIFVRDADRPLIWHSVVRWLARFRAVWMLIGLLWAVIGFLYVKNVFFFFVPPVAVYTFTLALTLGPVVVEERMKANWDLLLIVPYDRRAILLGKAAGALWHIRYLTYAIGILLMCVSAGVGIISVILIPLSITARGGGWLGYCLCGLLFLLPLLSSLVFIVDRIQQYALLAVAALASGTVASSIRAALSTATTVVLMIWLFEITATQAVLALEQGGTWQPDRTSLLLAATLGPVVSYISQMSLGHAALFTVGTLLLREVVLGSVWRWTLYSARSWSGV